MFAHPCPRPLGVAPGQLSLRGKAVQRRFEAAEHQFAGPLSVGLSSPSTGAAMGGAAAHAAKPGMRPSWAPQRPSRMGYRDRSDPLRGWMGVHIQPSPMPY